MCEVLKDLNSFLADDEPDDELLLTVKPTTSGGYAMQSLDIVMHRISRLMEQPHSHSRGLPGRQMYVVDTRQVEEECVGESEELTTKQKYGKGNTLQGETGEKPAHSMIRCISIHRTHHTSDLITTVQRRLRRQSLWGLI